MNFLFIIDFYKFSSGKNENVENHFVNIINKNNIEKGCERGAEEEQEERRHDIYN